MAYLEYRNLVKRVDFSKMGKVVEIPNLIKAQQESYEDFLQMNVPAEKRRDIGLQAVFKGGDDPNANIMIYEVDIPSDANHQALRRDLREKAMALSLDISIQHKLIFEAINRV